MLILLVIEDTNIVYRNYYDISVAVATPKGLVVPVLRNCDQLSFAGIEKSLAEYVIRISLTFFFLVWERKQRMKHLR